MFADLILLLIHRLDKIGYAQIHLQFIICSTNKNVHDIHFWRSILSDCLMKNLTDLCHLLFCLQCFLAAGIFVPLFLKLFQNIQKRLIFNLQFCYWLFKALNSDSMINQSETFDLNREKENACLFFRFQK